MILVREGPAVGTECSFLQVTSGRLAPEVLHYRGHPGSEGPRSRGNYRVLWTWFEAASLCPIALEESVRAVAQGKAAFLLLAEGW